MTIDPQNPATESRDSRILQGTTVAAIVSLLLILCGSAFRADHIFGYRDAGLFYFPLFQLVRNEWLSGRVPLWNPWLNAGQPLAAAATSSVFYPGQVLFLLPLPFNVTFNAYFWLHLLLAAGGAWTLARGQGRSTGAAGLAALGYTFSGTVLFQTCNIVFLCGAAWLPWGVHCGLKCLEAPTRPAILRLAAVLTLLVLSGDPQTGYHLGLILGLFGLIRFGGEWLGQKSLGISWVKTHLKRWTSLAAAALCAVGLSMIQLAPTAEFAGLSDRDAEVSPLSVWKVPGYFRRQESLPDGSNLGRAPQWYDAMIGRPVPPAKHYWQVYGFSAEPYRAIELIWPSFYGRGFPTVDRWTVRAGVGRAQFWTLSLYCGWIPFLLACTAFRGLNGDWRVRSLSWLAILSFLASWGEFGAIGLCRLASELVATGQCSFDRQLGDEVGGLYWLLVTCLPGYDSFRFPAKWLGVMALAISQLSAVGFDDLTDGPTRRRALRFAQTFLGILGVGFLIALGLGWVRGWHSDHQEVDVQATWLAVVVSALQGILLAVLSLVWLRWPEARVPAGSLRLGVIAIAVTTLDLAIAQRELVLLAPTADVYSGVEVINAATADREQTVAGKNSPQLRIYRIWEWTPAAKDYPTVARHQWETLAQNSPLLHRAGVINKPDTLNLNDATAFFDVLPIPGRQELICPRRSYDLWATEYFVLPSRNFSSEPDTTYVGMDRQWTATDSTPEAVLPMPTGEPLPEIRKTTLSGTSAAEPIRILRNTSALPRARIVHHGLLTPHIPDADREQWLKVMESLAFPFPGAIPLQTAAIIEDDDLFQRHGPHIGDPTPPEIAGETCKIIQDDPQCVQIAAELKQPGLVILADVYYPGWTLTVATEDGPETSCKILRVNRLQRGCWLPAGKHRLTYQYRPQSFFWGAVVSAMSLMIAGIVWWIPVAAAKPTAGNP